MRSDWLNVKCPDVGVKCKKSHVVKRSINCQKVLSQSSCKQTHVGTHWARMRSWSNDQNTLYKSQWQW